MTQSRVTGHAIRRYTKRADGTCDRCCGEILHGDWAGKVLPGDHSIPWVAGTIMCSACADRVEERLAARLLRASQ